MGNTLFTTSEKVKKSWKKILISNYPGADIQPYGCFIIFSFTIKMKLFYNLFSNIHIYIFFIVFQSNLSYLLENIKKLKVNLWFLN